MKFIVYDIEATCWEGRPPVMVQETIEIGALEIDQVGRVLRQFSRLIKPVIHPQMSLFCRKLTQIDQGDIDRAQKFPRVIRDFKDWIGVEDDDYLLASWGDFDRTQLMADCRQHRLEDWWLDEHINLKKQYQQIRGLPKRRGLKSAVKHEGHVWEGEQHRALTDAINTAKVFTELIDVWRY